MPWKRRGLRGIPSNGWSTRTACTARSRLAFRCPRARRPYGSARLLTRQAKGGTNRNVRLEAHKRGNMRTEEKASPPSDADGACRSVSSGCVPGNSEGRGRYGDE